MHIHAYNSNICCNHNTTLHVQEQKNNGFKRIKCYHMIGAYSFIYKLTEYNGCTLLVYYSVLSS